MSTNTESNPQSGPVFLEVHHTSGVSERVEIQKLSVRDIIAYQAANSDIPRCAELLAGKKIGWAESLTSASVYAVIDAGERLNDGEFAAMIEFRRGQSKRITTLMRSAGIPVD